MYKYILKNVKEDFLKILKIFLKLDFDLIIVF